MGIRTEQETETPRQHLQRLGVEIDASDHRSIEEIAQYFGYIITTNLNTKEEVSD